MSMRERGIIALDNMNLGDAVGLAAILQGEVFGFKVNDLMFGAHPREVIAALRKYGRVFVDMKCHDISQTVIHSVTRLAEHGADLITVHASGGRDMIRRAVETYKRYGPEDGLGILCVTILTSLSEDECREIYGSSPEQMVEMFAGFAQEAGAYGTVCSAKELGVMRAWPTLKKVTPGTRSTGAKTHDQARIDTPANAIKNGADILVIGRQITEADQPLSAVDLLTAEISTVVGG